MDLGARVAVGCVVVIICGWAATCVQAQAPLPAAQWTPRARLATARACRGEADWLSYLTGDCTAIAWVLSKRWHAHGRPRGRSYLELVRTYSSPLTGRSRRARTTQQLPWGPLTGRLAAVSRHWLRTLRLVEAWGRGDVPDPCPRAVHWGGRGDSPQGAMVRVCAGLGTANILYAVERGSGG